MKTQKFCLLINRYFTLAAIFTLIQQLIAASSTYFIAKLVKALGQVKFRLGISYYLLSRWWWCMSLLILPSSLLKKVTIWHGKVT